MDYINYFIKCCIRNITRILFKPKVLFIICVILIVFCLFSVNSHAIFQGDETYTDSNLVIFKAYESICNDFVTRLSNSSGRTTDYLLNYLNNPQYNYYLYYETRDGDSMVNASPLHTQVMWIIIYDSSYVPQMTTYDNYQGLKTSIWEVDEYSALYAFNGNSLIDYGRFEVQVNCLIPFNLLFYRSDVVTDYLTNPTKESAETVAGAVNNLTNTITDTNTTASEEEGTAVFNDLSNNTSSQNGNSTSLYQFFVDLLNIFTNSVSNSNTTELKLTLPFVDQYLVIPSDLISKHVEGTALDFIIQSSYYFMFGYYIIAAAFRIVTWFQDGEFIRGKFVPTKTIINDMLM